jgi:hypothetical protein
MYCPQCGAQADPSIKYCKQCGQALNRIRGVMSRGGASANWNDVWQEEVLEEHRKKRKKTPEEKRYEEIKGGVITTSVGVGATIFLYFLMNAIALNEPQDAAILRSVWLAGLVPTFIGLGILFNGVFISKRIVELKRQQESLPQAPQPLFSAVETGRAAQLPEAQAKAVNDYSVTEHTTARLAEKTAANVRRETN